MTVERPFAEKVGLLGLAGMTVGALTWIALRALNVGSVDPNASTLIGVIAGGLIAFGKDIIQAVRGMQMSAQLGKVTDQLAASGPAIITDPPPADAIEAADAVAGAAADKADEIKTETKP